MYKRMFLFPKKQNSFAHMFQGLGQGLSRLSFCGALKTVCCQLPIFFDCEKFGVTVTSNFLQLKKNKISRSMVFFNTASLFIGPQVVVHVADNYDPAL